jgi:sulfur carrier protein ThiS
MGKPMKIKILLRLYEELNDFLPPAKRKRRFDYRLNAGSTINDLLAKLGVPAAQVELALVNGTSVGFSHVLKTGDFVSFYPVFESFDVAGLVRMRKRPLRHLHFMTGPRLARLTCYLRLLGFDTIQACSWSNEKVIRESQKGKRIILTRNTALAASPEFTRIYLVRETSPKKQLAEVLRRFDLINPDGYSQLRSIIDGISTCEAKNR